MKQPSELNEHVGYWLRYVSNQVSHAFATRVEGHGVTVAEWVLLRALFDAGELNPSQLADTIGMSRGAVSKLVERLREKKLLARTLSKEDRRYQLVALTTAGRRLVPTLAQLADENDREFFGHLKSNERRLLVRIFEDMVRRHGWKNLPVD